MANLVNKTPSLPRPVLNSAPTTQSLAQYDAVLNVALFRELIQHASSINELVSFIAPDYTVATLPAATSVGQVIYVSDETGGATLAFADGSDWRRVQDRAVVS